VARLHDAPPKVSEVPVNEATVRALAEINRAFYRDHAAEFSATRSAPWPGWDPLLPALRVAEEGPLRVLDVGCGNGRFARYLARALAPRALALCGVDGSEPLLDDARSARLPGTRWQHGDVVFAPGALPSGPFDLVALFAVIHGVPGREHRRALLAACAERTAPGGLLVFTTWLRGERERAVAWNSFSSRARMPIDCSQLEPGDHLIPWGDGEHVVRYFHAFDDAELASCLRGLPLEPLQRYRADGRSGDQNEYFVFRGR
jgi:SAM-dependent methyltransferase